MGKKKETREIMKEEKQPTKTKNLKSGYVKLILLFTATVILILLLRNWYISSKEYQLSIPVIRDHVTHEINENEIANYLSETPSTVLYLCTAGNSDCRSLEKEFIKVIEKKQLQSKITYLNLSDVENLESFFKKFNKDYPYEKVINTFPTLILMEEGKIKDVANGTEKESLTMEEVKNFFETYKVRLGE